MLICILQVYLYEIGSSGRYSSRPRQVLPYAVLTYCDHQASDSLMSAMKSSSKLARFTEQRPGMGSKQKAKYVSSLSRKDERKVCRKTTPRKRAGDQNSAEVSGTPPKKMKTWPVRETERGRGLVPSSVIQNKEERSPLKMRTNLMTNNDAAWSRVRTNIKDSPMMKSQQTSLHAKISKCEHPLTSASPAKVQPPDQIHRPMSLSERFKMLERQASCEINDIPDDDSSKLDNKMNVITSKLEPCDGSNESDVENCSLPTCFASIKQMLSATDKHIFPKLIITLSTTPPATPSPTHDTDYVPGTPSPLKRHNKVSLTPSPKKAPEFESVQLSSVRGTDYTPSKPSSDCASPVKSLNTVSSPQSLKKATETKLSVEKGMTFEFVQLSSVSGTNCTPSKPSSNKRKDCASPVKSLNTVSLTLSPKKATETKLSPEKGKELVQLSSVRMTNCMSSKSSPNKSTDCASPVKNLNQVSLTVSPKKAQETKLSPEKGMEFESVPLSSVSGTNYMPSKPSPNITTNSVSGNQSTIPDQSILVKEEHKETDGFGVVPVTYEGYSESEHCMNNTWDASIEVAGVQEESKYVIEDGIVSLVKSYSPSQDYVRKDSFEMSDKSNNSDNVRNDLTLEQMAEKFCEIFGTENDTEDSCSEQHESQPKSHAANQMHQSTQSPYKQLLPFHPVSPIRGHPIINSNVNEPAMPLNMKQNNSFIGHDTIPVSSYSEPCKSFPSAVFIKSEPQTETEIMDCHTEGESVIKTKIVDSQKLKDADNKMKPMPVVSCTWPCPNSPVKCGPQCSTDEILVAKNSMSPFVLNGVDNEPLVEQEELVDIFTPQYDMDVVQYYNQRSCIVKTHDDSSNGTFTSSRHQNLHEEQQSNVQSSRSSNLRHEDRAPQPATVKSESSKDEFKNNKSCHMSLRSEPLFDEVFSSHEESNDNGEDCSLVQNETETLSNSVQCNQIPKRREPSAVNSCVDELPTKLPEQDVCYQSHRTCVTALNAGQMHNASHGDKDVPLNSQRTQVPDSNTGNHVEEMGRKSLLTRQSTSSEHDGSVMKEPGFNLGHDDATKMHGSDCTGHDLQHEQVTNQVTELVPTTPLNEATQMMIALLQQKKENSSTKEQADILQKTIDMLLGPNSARPAEATTMHGSQRNDYDEDISKVQRSEIKASEEKLKLQRSEIKANEEEISKVQRLESEVNEEKTRALKIRIKANDEKSNVQSFEIKANDGKSKLQRSEIKGTKENPKQQLSDAKARKGILNFKTEVKADSEKYVESGKEKTQTFGRSKVDNPNPLMKRNKDTRYEKDCGEKEKLQHLRSVHSEKNGSHTDNEFDRVGTDSEKSSDFKLALFDKSKDKRTDVSTDSMEPKQQQRNTEQQRGSKDANKFHGRTLLRGKSVPPRRIPHEALYKFCPVKPSGKLEVIPEDPRPGHYARKALEELQKRTHAEGNIEMISCDTAPDKVKVSPAITPETNIEAKKGLEILNDLIIKPFMSRVDSVRKQSFDGCVKVGAESLLRSGEFHGEALSKEVVGHSDQSLVDQGYLKDISLNKPVLDTDFISEAHASPEMPETLSHPSQPVLLNFYKERTDSETEPKRITCAENALPNQGEMSSGQDEESSVNITSTKTILPKEDKDPSVEVEEDDDSYAYSLLEDLQLAGKCQDLDISPAVTACCKAVLDCDVDTTPTLTSHCQQTPTSDPRDTPNMNSHCQQTLAFEMVENNSQEDHAESRNRQTNGNIFDIPSREEILEKIRSIRYEIEKDDESSLLHDNNETPACHVQDPETILLPKQPLSSKEQTMVLEGLSDNLASVDMDIDDTAQTNNLEPSSDTELPINQEIVHKLYKNMTDISDEETTAKSDNEADDTGTPLLDEVSESDDEDVPKDESLTKPDCNTVVCSVKQETSPHVELTTVIPESLVVGEKSIQMTVNPVLSILDSEICSGMSSFPPVSKGEPKKMVEKKIGIVKGVINKDNNLKGCGAIARSSVHVSSSRTNSSNEHSERHQIRRGHISPTRTKTCDRTSVWRAFSRSPHSRRSKSRERISRSRQRAFSRSPQRSRSRRSRSYERRERVRSRRSVSRSPSRSHHRHSNSPDRRLRHASSRSRSRSRVRSDRDFGRHGNKGHMSNRTHAESRERHRSSGSLVGGQLHDCGSRHIGHASSGRQRHSTDTMREYLTGIPAQHVQFSHSPEYRHFSSETNVQVDTPSDQEHFSSRKQIIYVSSDEEGECFEFSTRSEPRGSAGHEKRDNRSLVPKVPEVNTYMGTWNRDEDFNMRLY